MASQITTSGAPEIHHEEKIKQWTQKLGFYTQQLLIEENLQKKARDKMIKIEGELKKLNAENPKHKLSIQEKALRMAHQSLTETKNKTIMGPIETTAIGVTMSALTIAAMNFALSDVLLALTSFKLTAVTMISSIVGSGGYLGWRADKQASLNIKTEEANVKASKSAVDTCKIRCEEHEKQVRLKTAEKNAADQHLETAHQCIQEIKKMMRNIEFCLNQATKKMNGKLSVYKNTTFTPHSDISPIHHLEAPESRELEKPVPM